MAAQFESINAAFATFSKTVLNPAEVKEARLQHVEALIKDEQHAREVELSFLKDNIRKLILAFESSQLVNGSELPLLPAPSKKLSIHDDSQFTLNMSPRESQFLPQLMSN